RSASRAGPPAKRRLPTSPCSRISRWCCWPASTCRRRSCPGSRTSLSCSDSAMALIDSIDGARVEGHRPWPRLVVSEAGWRATAGELAAGRLTLLGLWGDRGAAHLVAHMAVLDEATAEIAVVTIECPHGSFPSVGALHPPAIRLERALVDLYGLVPLGLADTRPWLDHGVWGVRHPLGARQDAAPDPGRSEFLPPERQAL